MICYRIISLGVLSKYLGVKSGGICTRGDSENVVTRNQSDVRANVSFEITVDSGFV